LPKPEGNQNTSAVCQSLKKHALDAWQSIKKTKFRTPHTHVYTKPLAAHQLAPSC